MQYQFADIVALVKREAKSETTQDETEWLNRPENLSMWKEALAAAIDDVCEQFAAQKEKVDRVAVDVQRGLATQEDYDLAVLDYDAWKKKASRYRLGLEHRLREIKSRERTRNVLATDAARTVIYLLTAIESHKAALLQFGQDVPRPADITLWDSISTVDAS